MWRFFRYILFFRLLPTDFSFLMPRSAPKTAEGIIADLVRIPKPSRLENAKERTRLSKNIIEPSNKPQSRYFEPLYLDRARAVINEASIGEIREIVNTQL